MNFNLTREIKTIAKGLGFQKIGIAPAGPLPEAQQCLKEWLRSGMAASMDWIGRRQEERGNIHTYFPGARSLVAVGMNYYTGLSRDILAADLNFSNYAWGDDYHLIIKDRLFELLKQVRNRVSEANGIVCVDTSPVLEKVWAQRAGLGWQGKHTNLISRDYGSWLFLGELILDIELEYDQPFSVDLCGTCSACIDACPTKALEPYQLDARKCISYLTIEHRGDLPAQAADKLNGWIYGCDICQEVCPWNQKFARESTEIAFQAREELRTYTNADWACLDEEDFQRLFKNSPVKRTKHSGLMRNIECNS